MTASGLMAGKVTVVTAGYGDIGRAVCRRFCEFASDESDYITGVSLLVDGGASLPRRD